MIATRPPARTPPPLHAGRPHGWTLVELLVALPLLALAGLVAASLVLDAHRLARRSTYRIAATRELRHAALALAADLRPLAPADLSVVTDTSIEFDAQLGVGFVCGSAAALDIVHLLPVGGTDPLRTLWHTAPQPGDRAAIVLASPDHRGRPFVLDRAIAGVATDASACATAPVRAGSGAPVALRVEPPLPLRPETGAAVRLHRTTRVSTYRAGDGRWYLGRRTRIGGIWETIQPVAGPLRPPREGGLRLTLRDADGASVALPESARVVDIRLMAAPSPNDGRSPSPRVEPVQVRVVLRGPRDAGPHGAP
jgi:type II secretory pathway pseudopilin PulG